jgi:hypothetical protein
LKRTYGYQVKNDDGEMIIDKKDISRHIDKTCNKYVRQRFSSSRFLAYFDPPKSGSPYSKFFLGNSPCSDKNPMKALP